MVDQAEIHRKSLSDKVEDRREAVDRLRANFAILPDKEAAWQDLIRLTGDEDNHVLFTGAYVLGAAFAAVPDKEAAWQDLHLLTGDEENIVRLQAAYALGAAFAAVPDKEAAWKDLHRLTSDEHSYVRSWAAQALGAAFAAVPDKEAAWQDLHRLTSDEDSHMRRWAAQALGAAFSAVPDKEAAWQDLHRLTGYEEDIVRLQAAYALGDAFSAVPDKEAAWQDLHRLTGDEDKYVGVFANHSLGKASIFKATEADGEEEFRRELENALQYFERSAAEASFFNRDKFCLPFYRSFYVLTFKKEGSEAEVQRSLAEAKRASEGSKSRKDLLEAIENLSNALKETQSLRERGLEAAKCDLNSYRRYCDRAAELLDETEESAPRATRLIKRGLPIIDHQIKELLKEIKDKSQEICKTGDPLASELGCRIQKHAAAALETYNPREIQKEIEYILRRIGLWSDSITDEKVKRYIKDNIEDAANEEDIKRRLSVIRVLLEDIMSSKDTSKYVIRNSTVQIAEGEGHDQKMNVSSNSNKETHQNSKNGNPWYKDRNYLIALIATIITALGILISIY